MAFSPLSVEQPILGKSFHDLIGFNSKLLNNLKNDHWSNNSQSVLPILN